MIRLNVKEVLEQKNRELAQQHLPPISQTRLARFANIDAGTMRRILTGEANITIETLNKLANALQVHPKELFLYEPDPPPTLF